MNRNENLSKINWDIVLLHSVLSAAIFSCIPKLLPGEHPIVGGLFYIGFLALKTADLLNEKTDAIKETKISEYLAIISITTILSTIVASIGK